MTHTNHTDEAENPFTPCKSAWEALADFWQEELMKAAEQPESAQNVIRANLKEAVAELGKLRKMIEA